MISRYVGTNTGSSRLILMRRLIYISRSLIEAGDIGSIMSTSIMRNQHVGITGMLWTGDGCFAQVLEGDAEQVEATMERIRTDHRHTDIDVLFNHEVMTRQFGDWSMGYADDDAAAAFMIGFALGQRTAGAQRLYEIIMASIDSAGHHGQRESVTRAHRHFS